MGYGDPGCYNSQSKILTPHIDSLAREGMRFTDAHAPGPLCHMSRYGLLTGQYPFRIDVTLWPTQPLILYLAYPSPHSPWLPSAGFLGRSGAGTYGDFVMMVDDQIGRILDTLSAAAMTDDTLVLFASDNGPCWYDEDVTRFGHDSAGGLRGMKSDVWEAGHRMPFIVRWPGHVKPNSSSGQTICFTDLLATFAAILGKPLPDQASPDSFDLVPVLTGEQPEDQPIRGPVVMHAGSAPDMMMIRCRDWKLINQLGSGGFSKPKLIQPGPGDPEGQLYNLSDDLAETRNLYAERPEIVAWL